MSYVEKKDEEKIKESKNRKSNKKQNALKTLITEDTIVESPQDIIDKDPDINRKRAFEKVYEILLAMYPSTKRKNKQKKSKEREEFDRNLAFQELNKNLSKDSKQKEIEKEEEKDRGIERE